MIGANQYTLTWEHFAQLHEDKRTSFENLCRSLFQRKLCIDGAILHSEPNHPGVEVAPVCSKDGKKLISFQAKYFDSRIGYAQIKESAQEAISHYQGKLELIYLYCNKDIAATSKSYTEIENILNEVGIELILVTGQSILDQAAEYPSVLSCYFGLDSINGEWFESNLQLSLNNLGKRYNSLFNVDTDAQRNLAIFLGEPEGVVAINQKKTMVLDELEELRWRCSGKYKVVIEMIREIVESMPDICAGTLGDALKWEEHLKNKCGKVFEELSSNIKAINDEIRKITVKDSKYEELRNEEYVLARLLLLPEWLCLSKHEQSYVNNQILIVTGEMGTGKSQLLATAAQRLTDSKRPVLLLLGQTYISDAIIEEQIMNGLEGLSAGESFEAMLAIMDEISFSARESAVVFIDAINESRNREIWQIGINRMIALVEKYTNVKMVISLRSGFEGLTLSENVIERRRNGEIASIVHYGFADDSPSSIYEFLSKSGIPFSPEYYLQSEMANPLFLTWFCQTYSGEEQGLLSLVETVLEQADKEASKEAGVRERTGMLKTLLYELIDAAESGIVTLVVLLKLQAWATFGVTNKLAYIRAIERAGVLTSYVSNQEEIFYIGYNLLEDYLKASRIIEREKDKERITEYIKKSLLNISAEGKITNYGTESIFAMITSLYAIKFGEDCIEIIDEITNDWDKQRLLEQYIRAFTWRSSYITFENLVDLLKKYPVSPMQIWKVFIENATKEGSELNALGLARFLNRYELNRRDYLWTIEINSLNEENRIVNLAYFIESGNEFIGLSENKAFLLVILYSWLLSSTNRTLRDRVSKAMVEILKSHFSLCIRLLTMFKDVNDPYIIQRLFGVVFGAVMKRKLEYRKEFEELTRWVYAEIFLSDLVYPDILLRDYARLIIERFVYEYPESATDIDISKARPPYRSEPIPRVEETDYSDVKYHEKGVWRLLHSMKINMGVKGVGLYGDFGRYTFQAALNDFIGVDVANVYYYAMKYIFEELGYTNEYFGDYDTNKADFDRNHVKRIERIGKKYQWITMYNILARLSDTHNIGRWEDKEGFVYQGPWEPYVRDFDPTLNIRAKLNVVLPRIELPQYDEEGFLDIDASESEIDDWVMCDDKLFLDFPERLIQKDEFDREWVSIYFYQEHKNRLPKREDAVLGFSKGEQNIWSIASMFLVLDGSDNLTEEVLRKSEFVKKGSSNIRDCYSLFSREYAWSPGYEAEFERADNEEDEDSSNSWKAFPVAINVLWEKEYDASQDEVTSYVIPVGQIIREMSLYEKSINGIFYFDDEIAAFDLSITGNEHKELVIRRDILDKYIEKTSAKLFWTVVGEKQYFLGGSDQKWQRREGYFIYDKNQIKGSILVVENI